MEALTSSINVSTSSLVVSLLCLVRRWALNCRASRTVVWLE